MQIIKSLHAGLLHRTFDYQGKHIFSVSTLWGFRLSSGEAVLEQDLWQSISSTLGENEMLDMAMPKEPAEFIAYGNYYAPNNQPVTQDLVHIKLGNIEKTLQVTGDRFWRNGIGGRVATAPETFTEMPVSYKNAYGGEDYKKNPLGKGFKPENVDGNEQFPLPNIEYPDDLVSSPDDRIKPASLDRLDVMGEPRHKRMGTYDEKYIRERMPGFADDIDWRFFNEASEDQWNKDFYLGDEAFEILNMNKNMPLIRGQLPGVYGRCFVHHQEGENTVFKEIPTRLDTVWFFPNDDLGVVLHRGTMGVYEPDGNDIEAIMIAHENMSDPCREQQHYQDEINIRRNRDEAFKHMLNTQPLIPVGCRCGFELLMDEAGDHDDPMLNNLQNFSDAKIAAIEAETEKLLAEKKQEMEKQSAKDGVDLSAFLDKLNLKKSEATEKSKDANAIDNLIEKVLPGLRENPTKPDLTKLNLNAIDELGEYTQNLAKKKQLEVEQTLKNEILSAKTKLLGSENSGLVKQLENVLENMKKLPVLPRFDMAQVQNQVKQQYQQSTQQLDDVLPDTKQSSINETPSPVLPESGKNSIQKMIDSFTADIPKIGSQIKETYLMGAHFLPESRSPHEGQEANIGQAVIRAFKQGQTLANKDCAFVDFSNQNLSGIDLSGAYLEYANLTNTNFTGANLEGAIIVKAKIIGTNFSQANLKDANLGASAIENADFSDADLTNAVLGKANIKRSRFHRSRIVERQDAFLDTQFEEVDFTEAILDKAKFFTSDLSKCCFSKARLPEATFMECQLLDSDFSEAILDGTNLIEVAADKAIFNAAHMHNVRFVSGCSLNDCQFTKAIATEASFRDASLNRANFHHATISKADFGNADLTDANLDRATAIQTQFLSATMIRTSLDGANIMEGQLFKANLRSASFEGANLYAANFLSSILGETNFSHANLDKTILRDWRPISG